MIHYLPAPSARVVSGVNLPTPSLAFRIDAACSEENGWTGTKGSCKRTKKRPADTKEWLKRGGAAYIGGLPLALSGLSIGATAGAGAAVGLGALSAGAMTAGAVAGGAIVMAAGGIAGYKIVKFLLDKVDETLQKDRRAAAREMIESFAEGSPDEIRRKTKAFKGNAGSSPRQDSLEPIFWRIDAAEAPGGMTPEKKALIKERARAIAEGLKELDAAQREYKAKGGGKGVTAEEVANKIKRNNDAACNERFGWVGTKGSCKRSKPSEAKAQGLFMSKKGPAASVLEAVAGDLESLTDITDIVFEAKQSQMGLRDRSGARDIKRLELSLSSEKRAVEEVTPALVRRLAPRLARLRNEMDPSSFARDVGEDIDWIKPMTQSKNTLERNMAIATAEAYKQSAAKVEQVWQKADKLKGKHESARGSLVSEIYKAKGYTGEAMDLVSGLNKKSGRGKLSLAELESRRRAPNVSRLTGSRRSDASCSEAHGWQGTKGSCKRLSPSRLPSSLPKPASTKRPAIRLLNKEEYRAKLKRSAKLLGVAALMQFTGPALRITVSNALARAALKKGADPRLVRNLSRTAMQALGATGEYLRANPDANDRSAKDFLKSQLKSAAIAEKDRQLVKAKAKIVERAQQQLKRTDAADIVEGVQDVEEFAELLLALMLADERQRRSDSLPLPSDRLDRACAPNWHGTYPGGCKRGREPGSNSLRSIEKGGKKSKARQERQRRIKELRKSGVMPGGQKMGDMSMKDLDAYLSREEDRAKKRDAVTKEIIDRQNGTLKLLGMDKAKPWGEISLEDLDASNKRLEQSAKMFGIDLDKIGEDVKKKSPEELVNGLENAMSVSDAGLAKMRRSNLEWSTPKELRAKAKALDIKGRSKMRKADLINKILEAEDEIRTRATGGPRKPGALTYGDIVRARESAAKKLSKGDPLEQFAGALDDLQKFIENSLFDIDFNRKAKTAQNNITPYNPIRVSPETEKGAKELQRKLAEANYMAIALAAEKAKRDAIKKTLFSPDSKLNGAAVGNKIKRFRRQLDSLDFDLRTDGLELLETMLSPLSMLPLPSYRVDGGALPLPSRVDSLPLPSYRLDLGLGISRKKGERGGKRCGKGWTSKDNECEDKNVNRKLSRREKLKLANSIRKGRGLLPRPSNAISAQQRQAIQAMNPREKLAFANRIRVSRGLRPLTMGEMKKTARPGLLKSQKQATNELLGVGLPVEPMKVVRTSWDGEEAPRGYFTISGKDGRGLDARSLRAREEKKLNDHTGLDRYGNDQTNRSRSVEGYLAPPVDPKKPWGKRDLDDHLAVNGWELRSKSMDRDKRADNAKSIVAKAAGIAASAGTKQMSIRLEPETARDVEKLNDPRFRILRDTPFNRERGMGISLTTRKSTGRSGKNAQYQLIANIVDGQPVAPTLAEVKAAKSRQILDRLKDLQFDAGVRGVYTQGAETGDPNFGAQEAGPEKRRLGIGLTQQFAAEERLARSVEKLERRLIPRPEGKGNADFNLAEVRTAAQAAKAWNKAQGFAELKPGDTVNGFSAAQALAHDIAHPIALKAVGKNSEQLKKSYGVKTLVPEEAIVNAFEHLSRGDTLDASIQSGMRLSRVLARQDDVSAEEAAYYRSPEFAKKVREDVERGYMDKDHHLSMALIRNKNRVADTVFQGGEDFNNAPDAGPFRVRKNAAEQNEGLFEMAEYMPQTILVGSKGTKERMAQIREAAKGDFDFLDDLDDLGL